MATREEFLRQVWNDVINGPMKGTWIRNRIAASKKEPNGAFADAGSALERITAKGVVDRDLSLIVRAEIYEAVFSLLYMLDDPGVDGGNLGVGESGIVEKFSDFGIGVPGWHFALHDCFAD